MYSICDQCVYTVWTCDPLYPVCVCVVLETFHAQCVLHTWGLYYEARFGVSEVTSGSTPGFLYYEGGSLVIG